METTGLMQHPLEDDKKNNGVEFQNPVYPDGSYAEVITDHQNNRAEIWEYDAQGKNVMRIYGTFEEVTPISDDGIDTYIDKINSKYK